MTNDIEIQSMLSGGRRKSWGRRHSLGYPIRPVDVVVSDTVTSAQYEGARARGGHVLALVHDGQNFSLPRLARLKPDFNAGMIYAYLPDGTDFLYCRLNFEEWFGSLIGADDSQGKGTGRHIACFILRGK